jgi:hypothetical protein
MPIIGILASAKPAVPLSYSDTVLADSPLGFWLFNETSGSTLTDQGSGAKNMTAYNTPTLNVSTGLTGIPKTIEFGAGASEYASTGLQSTYNLAPSGNWTVEGWFSTTDSSGPDAVFAIRGNSLVGGNNDILCAAFTNITANKLTIAVTNSATTGSVLLTSSTTVTTGAYFYFTVTAVSGGALKLYINGIEEASSTASRYTGTNSRAFIAAAQSDGGAGIQNFFDGKCMAPAIYSSTLSTTRITEHYDRGI